MYCRDLNGRRSGRGKTSFHNGARMMCPVFIGFCLMLAQTEGEILEALYWVDTIGEFRSYFLTNSISFSHKASKSLFMIFKYPVHDCDNNSLNNFVHFSCLIALHFLCIHLPLIFKMAAEKPVRWVSFSHTWTVLAFSDLAQITCLDVQREFMWKGKTIDL